MMFWRRYAGIVDGDLWYLKLWALNLMRDVDKVVNNFVE